MRKSGLVILVMVLFAFATAMGVHAQAKKTPRNLENIEKTGVIEVKAAEKGQKYPTVLLKIGTDTFKLIPAKTAKDIMKKLEALAGKEVTVKGGLMPANDKYPMAAISVAEFVEGQAASAAPAPAPASATTGQPASDHPSSEHPGSEHPGSEHPSSEHPGSEHPHSGH